MILFGILVIVPAFVAFRRGHNGYLITSISALAFLVSLGIGYIAQNRLIYLGLWIASWLALLLYCLFVKGESGNQLDIKVREITVPDRNEDEVISISDDEFIPVKTYTQSWQQGELMDDIQKLIDANIQYKSMSGIMATLMVRERDFASACKLLGISEE